MLADLGGVLLVFEGEAPVFGEGELGGDLLGDDDLGEAAWWRCEGLCEGRRTKVEIEEIVNLWSGITHLGRGKAAARGTAAAVAAEVLRNARRADGT